MRTIMGRDATRKTVRVLTAAAAALGAAILAAGPALADGAPEIRVTVSEGLRARSQELDRSDLETLRADLTASVARALARSNGGALHAVRVDIVLEDARANRPTMARLNREPSLSLRSLALGGARVTGRLISADGAEHPFDLENYGTNLRDDIGATTWTDADRAFDRFASDLAAGRLRDR